MNAKRLIRSTMTVSFWTLLSRVLGFVRDMLFASVIGVNTAFDAYVVATKIPNFMRQLFAEGAFSQAFVPVLSDYKENHPKALPVFIQSLLGVLTLGLLFVLVLGVTFASHCVLWFAPGLASHPEQWALATHLLQITFPYLLFIAWVAFSGAILNTFNRFAVMAITPIILNGCLIVFVLTQPLQHLSVVENLATGVVVAGVLQWLWQLPFLAKAGISFRPRFAFHPGVKEVLRLMVPGLFGVSVAQISMVVDTWFASFLPTGSISWLYYSDRLTYFPLGIFGFAIASVILPTLSKTYARGDDGSKTLDWGVRLVLFLGLPAMLGLVLLAAPIVMVLFYHGAFSLEDVRMTSVSLMAYSLGLPAFMLIKVFASAFYARKDIQTPVKLAAFALVINLLGNFILVESMQHAGLALATAIAASTNALGLGLILYKRGWWRLQQGWRSWLLTLSLALISMIAFLLWQARALDDWHAMAHGSQYGLLLGVIVLAMLSYLLPFIWMKGHHSLDPNRSKPVLEGEVL